MAEILRGAPVAAALTADLTERAAAARRRGTVPTLALVRVGERAEDLAYERGIGSRCAKIGIELRKFLLPAQHDPQALFAAVREINADDSIHGCLLFRPLGNPQEERAACTLLSPEKDVDGVTPASLAAVYAGGTGFAPCTAQACLEILDYYKISLRGTRVTIVGRSTVIGKPAAMLLQSRDATVTMCHSKTRDLPAECRRAEILIAAAGRAGLVGEDCMAAGQILLDVGINDDGNGGLCGDADSAAAARIVRAYTPVPGGVGSVTTSVLAKHVIEAAERRGK